MNWNVLVSCRLYVSCMAIVWIFMYYVKCITAKMEGAQRQTKRGRQPCAQHNILINP